MSCKELRCLELIVIRAVAPPLPLFQLHHTLQELEIIVHTCIESPREVSSKIKELLHSLRLEKDWHLSNLQYLHHLLPLKISKIKRVVIKILFGDNSSWSWHLIVDWCRRLRVTCKRLPKERHSLKKDLTRLIRINWDTFVEGTLKYWILLHKLSPNYKILCLMT